MGQATTRSVNISAAGSLSVDIRVLASRQAVLASSPVIPALNTGTESMLLWQQKWSYAKDDCNRSFVLLKYVYLRPNKKNKTMDQCEILLSFSLKSTYRQVPGVGLFVIDPTLPHPINRHLRGRDELKYFPNTLISLISEYTTSFYYHLPEAQHEVIEAETMNDLNIRFMPPLPSFQTISIYNGDGIERLVSPNMWEHVTKLRSANYILDLVPADPNSAIKIHATIAVESQSCLLSHRFLAHLPTIHCFLKSATT